MSDEFQVGDRVRAGREISMSEFLKIPSGTVGVVTALGVAANLEVKFDGIERLCVINTGYVYKVYNTPDEASLEKEEGWDYVAHAIDLISGLDEPTVAASVGARKVMMADTLARLEQGRQAARIADALEKIARALRPVRGL